MTGPPRTLRCAIYTRKSSEEGLDQDFNSLQAQREACEAYIKSQSHEGWRLIPDVYDDGGHSGGTLERPAIKRLLKAVQAKRVDIIVIYKIDRLTRSLADFARLAEIFDKHGASFVSVTQQFNTTTSMGRLMLNVLLSFAQFEREITGERIRDKIDASKKKGMWMGGPTPIGYDVVNKGLVINETDAELVRLIFKLFLELKSGHTLEREIKRRGLKTRKWVSSAGGGHGDRFFTAGHLYRILSNPIYIGRVPHKKQSYPGLHRGIVSQDIWDATQKLLSDNTQGARQKRARTKGRLNILSGLIIDAQGRKFVSSHTSKKGKKYRYYLRKGSETEKVKAVRIPAKDLEDFVRYTLVELFADNEKLVNLFPNLLPADLSRTLAAAQFVAVQLQQDFLSAWNKSIHAAIANITYHPNKIEIEFDREKFAGLLQIIPGETRGMLPIKFSMPSKFGHSQERVKVVLGQIAQVHILRPLYRRMLISWHLPVLICCVQATHSQRQSSLKCSTLQRIISNSC